MDTSLIQWNPEELFLILMQTLIRQFYMKQSSVADKFAFAAWEQALSYSKSLVDF